MANAKVNASEESAPLPMNARGLVFEVTLLPAELLTCCERAAMRAADLH